MKSRVKNGGFSIVEFLFAMLIATVLGFLIAVFFKDMISVNTSAYSNMTAVLEGRKIIGVMVKELRSTIPSALGSYPIEAISTSTIIFFADVDYDNVADRVRYFLDSASKSLQRGVILASGDPPNYNAPETFSTLITDVSNSPVRPILDYYDGNYDGYSDPLPWPVNIPAIRLIKITVDVERDSNRAPDLVTLTSQAALRNLKDNI